MDGVLLINLGTPEAPLPPQVKRYLREFLMDPFVVDLPFALRWFLVNALILPKRPAESAAAYAKIWTERGSPLLFHTQDLTRGVQLALGENTRVEFAMRYGTPSIEAGVQALKSAGVKRITAFPLYPQYSLAATRSSIVELERSVREIEPSLSVQVIEDFYLDPGFIAAFAQVGEESLKGFGYDHLMFSFHGLPERQVKKTDLTGAHCLRSASCCDQIVAANSKCYRAQCFASARGISSAMGLEAGDWSVSFQSRLGRTPWIKPYTDVVFGELASKGVKRLAVMCPTFVADCLETLEEIRLRGRDQFRSVGGEDLLLVPSLNSHPSWVKFVAEKVSSNVGTYD